MRTGLLPFKEIKGYTICTKQYTYCLFLLSQLNCINILNDTTISHKSESHDIKV